MPSCGAARSMYRLSGWDSRGMRTVSLASSALLLFPAKDLADLPPHDVPTLLQSAYFSVCHLSHLLPKDFERHAERRAKYRRKDGERRAENCPKDAYRRADISAKDRERRRERRSEILPEITERREKTPKSPPKPPFSVERRKEIFRNIAERRFRDFRKTRERPVERRTKTRSIFVERRRKTDRQISERRRKDASKDVGKTPQKTIEKAHADR